MKEKDFVCQQTKPFWHQFDLRGFPVRLAKGQPGIRNMTPNAVTSVSKIKTLQWKNLVLMKSKENIDDRLTKFISCVLIDVPYNSSIGKPFVFFLNELNKGINAAQLKQIYMIDYCLLVRTPVL